MIHLGWRMVSAFPQLGYHVYRATAPEGPFTRLTSVPVVDQTNYRDTTVTDGTTYYYHVRLVDPALDAEGPPSNVARVTANNIDDFTFFRWQNTPPVPSGLDADRFLQYEMRFGDVDGDGLPDFLFAMTKGWESSLPECPESPDNTELIWVYLADGTKACGPFDTGIRWTGEFPWTLFDLDGDGRDEVIGVRADRTTNRIETALIMVVRTC